MWPIPKPRDAPKVVLELIGHLNQRDAHCRETLQRARLDRTRSFRPYHDDFVADIVEHLAAMVDDGLGQQAECAIEKSDGFRRRRAVRQAPVDPAISTNSTKRFSSTGEWYRPVTKFNSVARYSTNVVSCAPSSATNTAINSAGSVLLALAETRCTAPGGSKNDWPTLNVSITPPASCERISPLVI